VPKKIFGLLSLAKMGYLGLFAVLSWLS